MLDDFTNFCMKYTYNIKLTRGTDLETFTYCIYIYNWFFSDTT